MSASLDIDEVRRSLTARLVLDYYQHPTKRSGHHELESTACPRRADHSRRAFVVNELTGQWRCFPCAISGDILRLVAEFERISDRTDFPAVLARAADIAGVTAQDIPDHERLRRREAWRLERVRAEAAVAAKRSAMESAAIPTATAYWANLVAGHARGLEYLAERQLRAAAALIRFDLRASGSPSIPLHTSNGSVRNVVRRQLPELGEPKVRGLWGCPTAGTLLGRLGDIRRGCSVVITEGFADTITATLAWPGAVPLGAHGADNLVAVVRVAARRCMEVGARLLIVPHDDPRGRAAELDAAQAAATSGLSLRTGSMAVIKHGAKDLNDAWRGGWRPQQQEAMQ